MPVGGLVIIKAEANYFEPDNDNDGMDGNIMDDDFDDVKDPDFNYSLGEDDMTDDSNDIKHQNDDMSHEPPFNPVDMDTSQKNSSDKNISPSSAVCILSQFLIKLLKT